MNLGGPWAPGVALVAGGLSITSPCCLPLLPGYVSFVSASAGPDGAALQEPRRLSRRVAAAALFCVGFGVVFTALGATASVFGQVLGEHRSTLTRLSGILVIAMGLGMLGLYRLPLALLAERRFAMQRVPAGPRGAALLGAAFAFGWTPCIGPVLSAVLTLAASRSSVIGGSALLALYSAGLAVPFLAIAVWMDRRGAAMQWLRRRAHLVERTSGALLVTMGVAYLAGSWQSLFQPLQRWMAEVGWPPL